MIMISNRNESQQTQVIWGKSNRTMRNNSITEYCD
jgi:hypothetical protein